MFAARNAIDGIFENSAHGEYPYQSWGINRDPNAALTLDFGREVLLDSLLYIDAVLTIILLSSPPERKKHSGTSLTSCR